MADYTEKTKLFNDETNVDAINCLDNKKIKLTSGDSLLCKTQSGTSNIILLNKIASNQSDRHISIFTPKPSSTSEDIFVPVLENSTRVSAIKEVKISASTGMLYNFFFTLVSDQDQA